MDGLNERTRPNRPIDLKIQSGQEGRNATAVDGGADEKLGYNGYRQGSGYKADGDPSRSPCPGPLSKEINARVRICNVATVC